MERPRLISYGTGADVPFCSIYKAYRGIAASVTNQLHSLSEVLREFKLACNSFFKYLFHLPHILVWDRHAMVDGVF